MENQHFKYIKYEPLRFEGSRSLFEIHFSDDKLDMLDKDFSLTEQVLSFTQLNNHLVIIFQTLKNDEGKIICDINTLKEYFSRNRDIDFIIGDRDGKIIEERIFRRCSLVDLSTDTYSYLYEENDVEEVTVVLKYHNEN